MWPERRTVDVWTSSAEAPQTLRDADHLDGGEVLPGFRGNSGLRQNAARGLL
jgi:hypothetical protein